MFSKISRYRRLPDDVTLDAEGRRLRSRSPRPTPVVNGRFVHTLEQGDRLDHLAEEYYEQPRHWWRICDANAEYLSPWELVGSAPRAVARIGISRPGDDPPFSSLLAALRRAPGVESIVLGSAEQPFPERDLSGGGEPTWRWCLVLVFNNLTTSVDELLGLQPIVDTGFVAAAPERVSRLGKPVVIPSRVIPSRSE